MIKYNIELQNSKRLGGNMYKNYKMGNDGKLKYTGSSYKVAPERRFNKTTDEWQKRLDGNGPKPFRRRTQKKANRFEIKVIDIVYIIAFFAIIGIINKSNPMLSSNTNTVSNNSVILSQNPNLEFNFNNATSDFGNEYIRSTTGNYFLHVDISISNISNNDMIINVKDFKFVDENGTIYQSMYLNNQSTTMSKSVSGNNSISEKFTFQVPVSYKGQYKLYFDNDIIGKKDIISLNMK